MKVTRECPVCGSTYEADTARLRHGRQTTCSRACSYLWRAEKLSLAEDLLCSVCGKSFTRAPSHVKSKHEGQYCSRACHYEGRGLGLTQRTVNGPYDISEEGREAMRAGQARASANRQAAGNYGHSEETKRRLAHSTASALAEGRISRVSGLEDRVADCLDSLGVPYQRQVGIRDAHGRFVAVCDFVLGESLVVEVNGTYWHADPRVYPNELNATQLHNTEKFARKVQLLEELGFTVKQLWELDLNADLVGSVRAVLP